MQNVKGHFDDELIAAREGTEEGRKGNDLVDDKANSGVQDYALIWGAKSACASLRNMAFKTHCIMVEIVMARAATLKERHAVAAAQIALAPPPGDGEDTHAHADARFAGADDDTPIAHCGGLPQDKDWPSYIPKWPWSGDLLQALSAWAAPLRWIPPGQLLQHGGRHVGTSWAELCLDFELTTGLDTPSFHRPRANAVKGASIIEPVNLGVKARAFSRFVKAAGREADMSSLAPMQSSRVRSLAARDMAFLPSQAPSSGRAS